MRILGKDTLGNLQKNNKWLAIWLSELACAQWGGSNDVIKQFPKAKKCNDNLFLFTTNPERYCVEVRFSFPHRTALITALTKLTENNNE